MENFHKITANDNDDAAMPQKISHWRWVGGWIALIHPQTDIYVYILKDIYSGKSYLNNKSLSFNDPPLP